MERKHYKLVQSLSEMENIKDHSAYCKDDNTDVQEEKTDNFES
jgi:hypothetical protein